MRRILIMAAVVLLALGSASPVFAGSYSKVRHRAHVLHSKVERQVSEKAAGRDISAAGVRTKSGARRATGVELREFVASLRRVLHPPAPAPVAAVTSTTQAPASPAGGGGGGTYCGAYQFDAQTWQSVGGSGTACGASQAEQDRRAEMLHEQRGNAPWPRCGRGGASMAQIRQCENGGRY